MEEENVLRLLADLTMERDLLLEELEDLNSSIFDALKKLENIRNGSS